MSKPLFNAFGGTVECNLTVRQWLAAQAMIGILSNKYGFNIVRCMEPPQEQVSKLAKASYQIADAMIEAGKEKP